MAEEQHKTSIGGQAVMEGVMMRGPHKTAVSVRKPDGEIVTKVDDNGTKSWVNEVCEFYDLLPFFDENGDVIDDNKNENLRIVCEAIK